MTDVANATRPQCALARRDRPARRPPNGWQYGIGGDYAALGNRT